MTRRRGLSFRIRACQRCGGDAYRETAEDTDWRCLQCGRLVPQPSDATKQVLEPKAA